MENTETQVWLSFSKECHYIAGEIHDQLALDAKEVGKLIGFMMSNPERFGAAKL